MSYVDDWGGMSSSEAAVMQQPCAIVFCTHALYQHGTYKLGYQGAYINGSFRPGKCQRCKCQGWCEVAPITIDDVIDVADALYGDVTLSDIGFPSLPSQCGVELKWASLIGYMDGICGLDEGHQGDHEPEERP